MKFISKDFILNPFYFLQLLLYKNATSWGEIFDKRYGK